MSTIRHDIIHSNKRRSNWHNYHSRGIYMLTMCVEGRQPLLGRLTGYAGSAHERHNRLDSHLPNDKVVPEDDTEPGIRLTPLGEQVERCIQSITGHYPHVEVLQYIVMPDHIHIAVWVHEEKEGFHLGKTVAGFKLGCNRAYWGPKCEEYNEENRQQPSLFEDGYHDRILMRGGQLETMKRYIADNPRRAAIKRANPDLFTMRAERELCGIPFRAMGNIFLLDLPDKQVITCSRTIREEELQKQLEQALSNAEKGAITITAAISTGERIIARAIREAGFPLIVLLKNGFPPSGSESERHYKPQGVYFETCAAGRLLLLEPGEEAYTLPQIATATEQTLRQKAEFKHHSYSTLLATNLTGELTGNHAGNHAGNLAARSGEH